jgi:enterochelin esterase-like enzyme
MNKPIDAAARDTAADPISPAPSPRVPAALNRRGLLRGGVSSVLLGGLSLAACGGGEDVLAVVTPPPPPPPPAPPPAPSASAITEVSFASPVLGGTRYYKVYLPAGYETSGLRYPVIYLLHGRGDNLSAWGRNKALLDELIAGGKMPAAIAIMPDAPSSDRGGYWVDSAYTKDTLPGAKIETGIINELMPHVDATYRTIQHRNARALAGYSMGGYGALRYALAYPELFCGAIVMSPAVYTPLPPAGSSTREFGAFGTGSTLFVDEIYRAKNYPALLPAFAAKNLPLKMFIAAGDDEYKNENPAEAGNDIDMEAHLLFSRVSRTANISAELRILDGDHDWVVWQPALREGLAYLAKTLRAPE